MSMAAIAILAVVTAAEPAGAEEDPDVVVRAPVPAPVGDVQADEAWISPTALTQPRGTVTFSDHELLWGTVTIAPHERFQITVRGAPYLPGGAWLTAGPMIAFIWSNPLAGRLTDELR